MCTTCLRCSLARSNGRISSIAAPVVPMMLASSGSERKQARVQARRAVQIAVHANAARDGEERGQQDDERHVFFQHCVNEGGERGRRPEADSEWHEEQRPPRPRISCRNGCARRAARPAGQSRSTTKCRRTAAPTGGTASRRRARPLEPSVGSAASARAANRRRAFMRGLARSGLQQLWSWWAESSWAALRFACSTQGPIIASERERTGRYSESGC